MYRKIIVQLHLAVDARFSLRPLHALIGSVRLHKPRLAIVRLRHGKDVQQLLAHSL